MVEIGKGSLKVIGSNALLKQGHLCQPPRTISRWLLNYPQGLTPSGTGHSASFQPTSVSLLVSEAGSRHSLQPVTSKATSSFWSSVYVSAFTLAGQKLLCDVLSPHLILLLWHYFNWMPLTLLLSSWTTASVGFLITLTSPPQTADLLWVLLCRLSGLR